MNSKAKKVKFDGQFQRFEYVDEKSSKFWEIRVGGTTVDVRYGKIGTTGQKLTKAFDDGIAAHKHVEKLVGEKLKGGYVSSIKSIQSPLATNRTSRAVHNSSLHDLGKKLELDERQVLIGDFPKTLDLGDLELDLEVFMHLPEVFSAAEELGLAPQANLAISNSATIETLKVPSDYWGMSYLLIENCVNLRSIEIYSSSPGSEYADQSLRWLICKNVPKLETFVAGGSLLSLQIEAAPRLAVVKLEQCPKLHMLFLIDTPNLKELGFIGCKKLGVGRLTEEQEARLAIESQLNANCSNPIEPAYPFRDLTICQIQEVLEVINNGMMMVFKDGWQNKYDDDPTIWPFSINLLRPLEHTYTDGSGEQYAYELVIESGDVYGEHSSEDCLNHALRSISGLIPIDGNDAPTVSDVYEYLKKYREARASLSHAL